MILYWILYTFGLINPWLRFPHDISTALVNNGLHFLNFILQLDNFSVVLFTDLWDVEVSESFAEAIFSKIG